MKQISQFPVPRFLVPTVLAIGLLTACSVAHNPKVEVDAVEPLNLSLGLSANTPTCRVGPDDGPVLADRGIGGTGGAPKSPPRAQASERVADRGIVQV